MREFAPAKINVSLYIGRPRADGYHPLVSVVQPLALGDDLELAPGPGPGDEVLCPGVEGENLAARALALFRAEIGWNAPPRRVTIRKRTPVAAGMGGGSSDAAATLRLAAAAAGHPDDPRLDELAPRLGADVRSLLWPRRCLMTGVGERVEPLAPPEPYGLLVVPGAEPLATPAVYAAFDRLGLGREPEELADLESRARAGADERHNDLAAAALHLQPAIAGALDAAREAGAEHAMVSGSGPTVVGFFASEEAATEAAERLRARHPGTVATRPLDATGDPSARLRHNPIDA
jgi:4-diphosphocytidyl-2-C-methyl-D-erythritol kinase